jgi:uncharacterized protein (TIGR02996 family)
MRLGPQAQERVRREFFPEDCERALGFLNRWSTTACAPGESPGRMHGAVLNIALGDYAALKRAIGMARVDYRDVLCPGRRGLICEPGEGAAVPEEEAFLAGIRRKPADNATRLVYADWLQERGDDRRAEYLRVLCRWLAGPSTADRQLIERERELRKGLGRWWLARARGLPVRENREQTDAALRGLAEELARVAGEACGPGKKWRRALLDARYEPDEGNSKMVRVWPARGPAVYPEPTAAIDRGADDLWRRQRGPGRWFGLALTVTPAGEPRVKYNYDPECIYDEPPYDIGGARGVLKRVRGTPPRCIRGLTATPVPVPDRGLRAYSSAFRLACRCGGERGRVLGYSLADYNREYDGPLELVSPLAFGCAACGRRAQVSDTGVHGYHGELGCSAVYRGRGRRRPYVCPRCGGQEFGVVATFVYGGEALPAEEEDLPAAREDSFNGLQLHGTCAGCGRRSFIAGYDL